VRPGALLLAALAGPGFAAPPPVSLAATADLLYRRDLLGAGPYGVPGDRPGQYQYGLSLVANRGPWAGAVTLRDVDFYQQEPDTTLDRGTTRIYKRYLKYDSGRWSFQAGDFNTLLGRGLVLSVIQNPSILLEDTIDGLDARLRAGRLELHALGGTVTTGQQDQSWRVAGAEATVEYLPDQRLGLRAATIQDGRLPPFMPPVGLRQCRSVSLSGQDRSGSFSYYGELGHMDFRDQSWPPWPVPVDPRQGEGGYGNLSWHRRGWFLMAECKNYKNFDNGLNNPPLADRDTEQTNKYDGAGRRLYAQYSFQEPDLTVFASAGAYREGYGGELDHGNDVYGGFKLQDFGRLDLAWTYGLRTVQYLEKRTDATLTWRFTPTWSLGLTLRDKRNRPAADPYEETDLTVQLACSPRFSVYLLQQRASVPVFDATRLYQAGARVNLARGSYLEGAAGRLRGGEVCAGGQCVTLPPFRGWRLAAHLRF